MGAITTPMSLNIIANSRAYVALLAALPGLGVTVAEGQTPLAALQARLSAAPATPAAPTAEAAQAATVALLTAAGIPVAAGQAPAAAITAFLAELEGNAAQLATAQQSVATLTTQLATAQSRLAIVTAEAARGDRLAAALAGKGIKITAADPAAGPTAAEIDAAIEARISTRAAELLAAGGTPAVTTAPAAGAGSQVKATTERRKGIAGLAGIFAAKAKA